jgi:hypothetical protein
LKQWNCAATVLYVFERAHKYQAEADAAMKAIANHHEARQDFRYANHVFEPKTEYGLQTADLFSWTMTKAHVANGKTPAALRPFARALLKLGRERERMKVYPFTGKKLKRLIHEQMVGHKGIPVDFGPRKRAFRRIFSCVPLLVFVATSVLRVRLRLLARRQLAW